jgi:GDPmannose 4,6-dehydratase
MLQGAEPEDYVIASGEQYSVREFITWAAEDLGFTLEFEGKGLDEVGVISAINSPENVAAAVGDVIIRVDARYFRPAEVDSLLGDATKASKRLGWVPEISARELCREMVQADLEAANKDLLLRNHGYSVFSNLEIGN